MKCDHYRIPNSRHKLVFEPGSFSKNGAVVEVNKEHGTSRSLSRMSDYKLRKKPNLNLSQRDDKSSNNHSTRYTAGNFAGSTKSLCLVIFKFTCFHNIRSWYLLNKESNLCHDFHPPIQPKVTKLNNNHLNAKQLDYMRVMYEHGVGTASMSRVMTMLAKKRGHKGEYLAQTVRNMALPLQDTVDKVSGVDPKWSVAQKTLHSMNEYVIIITSMYNVFVFGELYHTLLFTLSFLPPLY